MDAFLRALVWRRAGGRCEYCRIHQHDDPHYSFHVEHIIARQHGGSDDPRNRALACHACNLSKGPNLAGRDTKTGKKVWLFNPRRHKWAWHFCWDGPVLVGRTPIGRATVAVLGINHPKRVELRQALIEAGAFPPA